MMDNDTKVILSEGELAMARDKDIILTKQAIITKSASLFNHQIPFLSVLFKNVFVNDNALLAAVPKISKGENYRGFPYVIMDYPASFGKQNIFALRTMFWWGNFISVTLHLKGTYKEMYASKILEKVKCEPNFYIAIGEEEWQHDFIEDNYIKSEHITKEAELLIEEKSFFKVALKYELHHWNMMQSLLPVGYEKIKKLLIY